MRVRTYKQVMAHTHTQYAPGDFSDKRDLGRFRGIFGVEFKTQFEFLILVKRALRSLYRNPPMEYALTN